MKQHHLSTGHSAAYVLLAALFFLSVPAIKAQGVCTVTGTTDGSNAPFDICSAKFTSDASVYTSTEICYGTISSVRYYVTGRFNSPNISIKIYMKTIGTSTFTSGSTYSSMLSGATLVYSNGAQSWPALGWQSFTLTTPFSYTSGNLVIICEADWNAVPACGTAPVFGYGLKTASDQYWNASSLSALNSTTGSIDQYRPGMTLAGAIALPIELETFTATPQDQDKIVLNWTTASEVNNDYYAIERSGDGINFEEIARVKGAGNSTVQLNYHTTDERPLPGINYYRLRQVDFDQVFTHSRIVAVELDQQAAVLSNSHPNPTSGNFGFDFYAPVKGTLQIKVSDYSGRLLKEESREIGEGRSSVDTPLDGLAAGVYLFKVSFDKQDFTSINKVIKN